MCFLKKAKKHISKSLIPQALNRVEILSYGIRKVRLEIYKFDANSGFIRVNLHVSDPAVNLLFLFDSREQATKQNRGVNVDLWQGINALVFDLTETSTCAQVHKSPVPCRFVIYVEGAGDKNRSPFCFAQFVIVDSTWIFEEEQLGGRLGGLEELGLEHPYPSFMDIFNDDSSFSADEILHVGKRLGVGDNQIVFLEHTNHNTFKKGVQVGEFELDPGTDFQGNTLP